MTSAMRINKVAVFVDGENIAADHAAEIDRLSRELGDAVIRRVYGNVQRIVKWDTAPGYRVIHSGSGKNATDMLIAIDVMELVQTEAFDTIVIASSDRDFTHLALRLRERLLRVVGAGGAQAPDGFRLACSQFKTLGVGVVKERVEAVGMPVAVAVPQVAKPVAAKVTDLDGKVRSLISANSTKGRGMPLKALANCMKEIHGMTTASLPSKTWRDYITSKPNLYDIDPKGNDACVRYKPAGFAVH